MNERPKVSEVVLWMMAMARALQLKVAFIQGSFEGAACPALSLRAVVPFVFTQGNKAFRSAGGINSDE